ncbi:hypothetical protein CHARACLAT_031169 [Characodon lateralis]|uniref:Uncharacterized protein n=1 Tax=Characodon lateralis TaxID=208331 RepID=A0ABU7F0X8_9TELE|nr:hypothetical protein [Characodon lateralis]
MVQGGNARCYLLSIRALSEYPLLPPHPPPKTFFSLKQKGENLTHASPTGKMPPALRIWALLCVSLCSLCQPADLKKAFRCPSTCSCTKESIICVGSSNILRSAPNEITSLSIVNGTFSDVREAMFAHMPTLQLLLLNSNSLTTIRDDAFSGLPHLEYL